MFCFLSILPHSLILGRIFCAARLPHSLLHATRFADHIAQDTDIGCSRKKTKRLATENIGFGWDKERVRWGTPLDWLVHAVLGQRGRGCELRQVGMPSYSPLIPPPQLHPPPLKFVLYGKTGGTVPLKQLRSLLVAGRVRDWTPFKVLPFPSATIKPDCLKASACKLP